MFHVMSIEDKMATKFSWESLDQVKALSENGDKYHAKIAWDEAERYAYRVVDPDDKKYMLYQVNDYKKYL